MQVKKRGRPAKSAQEGDSGAELWDEGDLPTIPGEEDVEVRVAPTPPRDSVVSSGARPLDRGKPTTPPGEDENFFGGPNAPEVKAPAWENSSKAARRDERPMTVPPWANAFPSGPPAPPAPKLAPADKALAIKTQIAKMRRELAQLEEDAGIVATGG